jgi:hypothetical protein
LNQRQLHTVNCNDRLAPVDSPRCDMCDSGPSCKSGMGQTEKNSV